uniref:hypothetical protein n=1 Tax=Ningiella ruwaisensis TaxID=2364274 RepID=UPI0010A0B0BC|nr:hypothetical protein [Ningiella ruwaisensis]
MDKVISALNENLQLIYRKALDADAVLDSLQQSGKGKFQTIFSGDTPFHTRSKRFKDYIEEVAGDVAILQGKGDLSEQDKQQKLPLIVKKLELLITTLEQFKQSLKEP